MSKRFTALSVLLLIFVAGSLIAAPSPRVSNPSDTVGEAARDEVAYTTDRAIIRDEKTGALRKPTRQEIAETVRTIKAMTTRSGKLEATTSATGLRRVALNGEYAMVIVARPTADGGYETLCVSNFEQAAEFLGLRPETTPTVKPIAQHRSER